MTERKTTSIEGDPIGSLVVDWDCETETTLPSDRHPDNQSNQMTSVCTVGTIHSVEFQIFDKVGVDITKKVLKNQRLVGILEEQLLENI